MDWLSATVLHLHASVLSLVVVCRSVMRCLSGPVLTGPFPFVFGFDFLRAAGCAPVDSAAAKFRACPSPVRTCPSPGFPALAPYRFRLRGLGRSLRYQRRCHYPALSGTACLPIWALGDGPPVLGPVCALLPVGALLLGLRPNSPFSTDS